MLVSILFYYEFSTMSAVLPQIWEEMPFLFFFVILLLSVQCGFSNMEIKKIIFSETYLKKNFFFFYYSRCHVVIDRGSRLNCLVDLFNMGAALAMECNVLLRWWEKKKKMSNLKKKYRIYFRFVYPVMFLLPLFKCLIQLSSRMKWSSLHLTNNTMTSNSVTTHCFLLVSRCEDNKLGPLGLTGLSLGGHVSEDFVVKDKTVWYL